MALSLRNEWITWLAITSPLFNVCFLLNSVVFVEVQKDIVKQDDAKLAVGKIAGVYGLKGWLKIYSHTQPIDNILQYNPWWLDRKGVLTEVELEAGKLHGKGVLAKLKGIDDPDEAKKLVGTEIFIESSALAPLPEDEFYWRDLIGLVVQNRDGVILGKVDDLMETGANLVLVVKGETEILIPWIWESVILEVDLQQQRLVADWDPDF